MTTELEIRPIVDYMFLQLNRIRTLAAGVATLNVAPPTKVARADMEGALDLANGIEVTLTNWQSRMTDPAFGGGWGGTVARILYGEACDGAAGIRRALKSRLTRPPADQIEPVAIQVLIAYDSRITGSRELLLVLSREQIWSQSSFAAINRQFKDDVDAFSLELFDVIVSLIPVVGPIYDIGTGVIGYRPGKSLNTSERVMRVAMVGVGVLLNLTLKGAKLVSHAVVIMDAGRQVGRLRTTLSSVEVVRSLVIALSRQSPKNVEKLMAAVARIRAGGDLSADVVLVSKILYGVNQTALATQWAVLVRDQRYVRRAIGKVSILDGTVLQKGEEETLQALAKHLPDEEILMLPNMKPSDLKGYSLQKALAGEGRAVQPRLVAGQGGKRADLVFNNGLGDIISPETDNIDNICVYISRKSGQGSTIVVNTDFTGAKPDELVGALRKVWGNPLAMNISEVIVLNSKGLFRRVQRPIRLSIGDAIEYPVWSLANLRKAWETSIDTKSEPATGGP